MTNLQNKSVFCSLSCSLSCDWTSCRKCCIFSNKVRADPSGRVSNQEVNSLANTKSALKMIRVAERRRARNKPVRSAVKTYISKAEQLIARSNVEGAASAVVQAIRELDMAATKGVIHKNNAARRKSRLMRKLNLLKMA